MGFFDTLRSGASAIGGALSSGFQQVGGFVGDVFQEVGPAALDLGVSFGTQFLADKFGVNLPSRQVPVGPVRIGAGQVRVPVPTGINPAGQSQLERLLGQARDQFTRGIPPVFTPPTQPGRRPTIPFVSPRSLGTTQPVAAGNISPSGRSPLNLSGARPLPAGRVAPAGITEALMLSPVGERGNATTSVQEASLANFLPGGAVNAGFAQEFAGGALRGGVGALLPGFAERAVGLDRGLFRRSAFGSARASRLVMQENPDTGTLNFWRHAGTLRGAILAGDIRNVKATTKRARKLCGPLIRKR